MKTVVTLSSEDIREILINHIANTRNFKPQYLDITHGAINPVTIETKDAPAFDPEPKVNWSEIAASTQDEDDDEDPR